MPPTLDDLRLEARGCTACPLWRNATRTVLGTGDPHAAVMLLGEQPGDLEDRAGQPFVGPAGKLLDRAMADAGLARPEVYRSNVVKHFKWVPRGKLRLHKTPAQGEIDACRRWLDAELVTVCPLLAVCLGATAARALFGRGATIAELRGRVHRPEQRPALLATIHPSYVLRVPAAARAATYDGLVADLRLAVSFMADRDAGTTDETGRARAGHPPARGDGAQM